MINQKKITTVIGVVLLALAALSLLGAIQSAQALYDPNYADASVNFAGVGVLFNLVISIAFATGGVLLVRKSRK
jgi:hypothetical protein